MIEQISEFSELSEYKQSDIFSIRVLSLAMAYGFKYPFVSFYRQTDDNGVVTAILSSLDKVVTLSVTESADGEELADFLSFLGFSSLFCTDGFDLGNDYSCGVIMKSSKKIELPCDYRVIDEYPHLFDLFNFIDYPDVDFEAWYVDISHRIRHGTAKAYSVNIDDEIISSAIFSSIYNDDAVISAVQTKPEFRRMGYASALVSAMCCEIKGTVYLMREQDKNESFYQRLGFENCGKWRMYK